MKKWILDSVFFFKRQFLDQVFFLGPKRHCLMWFAFDLTILGSPKISNTPGDHYLATNLAQKNKTQITYQSFLNPTFSGVFKKLNKPWEEV